MKQRAVIAGFGHTAFGRLPGRDTLSLNAEACGKALADAGLEKAQVDALFAKVPTSKVEFMYGQKLAEALGLMPKVGGVWDQGGASNISMISFAAMAIENGQCEIALVTLADNPKSGTTQAYDKAWGEDAVYGWFSVSAGYAMVARRHMHELGTRAEDMGEVAVACRKHGANNPSAQLRKAITLDEYMASPWIVEPFRRDDICLVSDGAAAVVVTSEKKARQLGIAHAVPILGFGQGQSSWDVVLRPDMTHTMAGASAESAYRMAGLGPKDMDVAQVYDCFTITVLMTLEAYGFCKPGQAGGFVRDGGLEIGGNLPLNTSGGLLSETGMPGLQLVIEGVRQMRGASVNQVAGAKHCIVSNQGGIMHTHSTLILGAP
jgi:acetyl-CoA acetyltransferase